MSSCKMEMIIYTTFAIVQPSHFKKKILFFTDSIYFERESIVHTGGGVEGERKRKCQTDSPPSMEPEVELELRTLRS